MDVDNNIQKRLIIKNIKVLLTEDDMGMAEVVMYSLKIQDPTLEIVHCSNLLDAIAYIQNQTTTSIQLLITDWNIPNGNEGGSIIQATREKFPKVQVIVMTGNPSNLPEISKNYNPNQLLPKPFSLIDFAGAASNCRHAIENIKHVV